MKTIIGIALIFFGIVALSQYPNLGRSVPETFGAFIGTGLVSFLPGILLIRSDNKNKKE